VYASVGANSVVETKAKLHAALAGGSVLGASVTLYGERTEPMVIIGDDNQRFHAPQHLPVRFTNIIPDTYS
jgi:hypothetical protein